MVRAFMCSVTVLSVSAGLAQADVAGGVLTADVEIASDLLFGGTPFAAVINPDAVGIYDGGIGPVNTTGYLTGPVNQPNSFAYVNLPVYAILDLSGAPVGYGTQLFGDDGGGGQDLQDPLFTLSHVGDLTFEAVFDGFGSYASVGGGSFALAGGPTLGMVGSLQLDLPPTGQPNFLWYGMHGDSILMGNDTGETFFSIESNDSQWMGNGWPGVTLDKNFFPIPTPAGIALLALGGLSACRRNRGKYTG